MQQTVVEQQDPRQSQILPGWRRELWMTDEVKSSDWGLAERNNYRDIKSTRPVRYIIHLMSDPEGNS